MRTSKDHETVEGDVTLLDPTGSDSAGARLRKITLQGLTAAAGLHTLAEIVAKHEGAAADEKGTLLIYVNDGDDGTTPTLALTIASTGVVTFASTPAGLATAASVVAAIATAASYADGVGAAAASYADGVGAAAVATAASDATTKANAAAAASQPLSAELTAIAAITGTAFGRALVGLADAAALRTAAGLAAVAASGSASDLATGTLPIARIANGDVSNAKLANVASGTVKGLMTGGPAAPGDLTALSLAGLLAGQSAALSAMLIGSIFSFSGAVPQNATNPLRFGPTVAGSANCVIPAGWKFFCLGMSFSATAAPPSGQTGTVRLYVATVDQSANFGALVISNTVIQKTVETTVPGTPYVIDATGGDVPVEVRVANTPTTGSLNIYGFIWGVLIRP